MPRNGCTFADSVVDVAQKVIVFSRFTSWCEFLELKQVAVYPSVAGFPFGSSCYNVTRVLIDAPFLPCRQ